MKKKILTITLAAALGLGGLFALNANAQTWGQRRAPGALLQKAKEHLGITDAQAEQIRAVLKEDRETLAARARSLHESHSKLRGTIRDDKASEADIRAVSAELAQAQADMAVERHKLFGNIKPILTAEQLEKIAAIEERIDAFVDKAIGAFDERLAE
jgi:Spy/CpxP family protein refolding chaperone